MVRIDGAGASHELIEHLLKLASPRRKVLFTCGWMITPADEDAIRMLPALAWKPGIGQDGNPEEDKHVAEVTHLMSRAGKWPSGLRWIVRRTRPSRRQAGNLTDYEKATGWRYSITCTNIPQTGIPGVPGSHHPQYIDVVHRQHAVVEDGVRNGKAMGLRNLPSKTWQVNKGWVIAANIAADLAAWSRCLGLYDQDGLNDAESVTLRYRLWNIPARIVRHAPPADPEDQPRLALEGGVPDLLAAAVRDARTRLTSTIRHYHREGGTSRRGRIRRTPRAHRDATPADTPTATRHHSRNAAPTQSVTRHARPLNHRGQRGTDRLPGGPGRGSARLGRDDGAGGIRRHGGRS
jgi:hypothetical protein